MNYTHLSQSERYQIQRQYKAGLSRRQIADGMNRAVATISRELCRNAVEAVGGFDQMTPRVLDLAHGVVAAADGSFDVAQTTFTQRALDLDGGTTARGFQEPRLVKKPLTGLPKSSPLLPPT